MLKKLLSNLGPFLPGRRSAGVPDLIQNRGLRAQPLMVTARHAAAAGPEIGVIPLMELRVPVGKGEGR